MAINQPFIDQYVNLLIKQYWEKEKAKGHITAIETEYSKVFDWFTQFQHEFDLDNAVGNRLDIIGKIVGISRIVPFGTAKILFGFDGDSTARGMADLFNDATTSAPFASLFSPNYTDTQLDDNLFRTFIKAKIAKNVVHAVMVSDGTNVSIQDSIQTLFDGNAAVYDNRNMTLTLQVGFNFDEYLLSLIIKADLLPRPQGVDYKIVTGADINSFGFSDDPNALGFGDLFDSTIGGSFATLYTF